MISKKIKDLNNTIYKLNLTDMCKTLYPTAVEYVFISGALVMFFRINCMLDHKTSLNKLKIF